MTDELLELILKDSFTHSSAMRHLHLLKERLVIKLFGGSRDPESQPEYQMASGYDKNWLAQVPEEFLNKFNQDNLYDIFNQTEEAVKAIEPLVIFLAVELPETEINTLGRYVQQHIGPRLLIEVRINPNLIAGAAFSRKGIYKDFSLKQRISDNHQTILRALEEYHKH